MVWSGQAYDGAALVLAHTAAAAKKLGGPIVLSWDAAESWIDIRVQWMRDADMPYLQSKYGNGPVVIECPTTCLQCRLWSTVEYTDGYCKDCWNDLVIEGREGKLQLSLTTTSER
jgi:hypothetical protein